MEQKKLLQKRNMESKITKICWMCGNEIDLEDKFCRFCGKGQDEKSKFPYTIGGVIAQFFLIGPLCLFSLWKSPIIEKKTKSSLALFILALMAVLAGLLIYGIYFIFSYYAKIFSL